jgi:hypothetical protein
MGPHTLCRRSRGAFSEVHLPFLASSVLIASVERQMNGDW